MAAVPGPNVEYTAWVAPTSPAGTPATSPTITDVGISTAYIWRVEVRIPPGHAGMTGIALVDSGAFLIPFSQGAAAWLVGDDDLLVYPLGKETGTNLQLWSYNTSADYAHGWQVRILYTPVVVFEDSGADIITPEPAAWLAEIAPLVPRGGATVTGPVIAG